MASNVSQSETIKVCPECGGSLVYGSHDPCEGWAFWCDRCGFGPIWFDDPRAVYKQPAPIIDAEDDLVPQSGHLTARDIEILCRRQDELLPRTFTFRGMRITEEAF